MTSIKTSKIFWKADTLKGQALGESIEKLAKIHGEFISFSYVEWRPGAGILKPDSGPAPILFEGAPDRNGNVAVDEMRLFSEGSGLHAIEDAGNTRWMRWRTDGAPEADWSELEAKIVEYPVLMLDERSARRFGLDAPLPEQPELLIREYRFGGQIFCWNLMRENKQ